MRGKSVTLTVEEMRAWATDGGAWEADLKELRGKISEKAKLVNTVKSARFNARHARDHWNKRKISKFMEFQILLHDSAMMTQSMQRQQYYLTQRMNGELQRELLRPQRNP